MKAPRWLLVLILLAFTFSCSEDDGFATLNGTWTVETTGFIAEFEIDDGEVGSSTINIKGTAPGEFTAQLEFEGGEINRADKRTLRYIHLGNNTSYLRILGLEINDSKTTLRGSAWFYYSSYAGTDLVEDGIEEFVVNRKK